MSGQGSSRRERRGRRREQSGRGTETGHGHASRGSEDGGNASPNLVYLHTILDRLLSNEHVHDRASHVHGSKSRRFRDPGGEFLFLSLHHHPPLHIPQRASLRAPGTKDHSHKARPDLPPTGGDRPCFLRSGHGGLGPRGEEKAGKLHQ